jgi:hypothetical protein
VQPGADLEPDLCAILDRRRTAQMR